ncbi:MAG: hypothetical protein P4M15_01395 [Alphaproteobacteria bacterium]|nr:hypothetical protein [Alphaproteobacteria bacterium]
MNKPLEQPFRDFLSATVADASAHARFLNLLSMLEHMGSRKIMLSQMKGILTQDILKHLAEETRHAFFFKREAEKMSGSAIEGYPSDRTMAVPSGRLYFGRLDAGLTSDMPADVHAETGYLWVSLIVELRAIWGYRMYQDVLAEAASPLSLKSIIAEEDRHLVDMVLRLEEIGFDAASALPLACELEKRLFGKLLGALQTEHRARAA